MLAHYHQADILSNKKSAVFLFSFLFSSLLFLSFSLSLFSVLNMSSLSVLKAFSYSLILIFLNDLPWSSFIVLRVHWDSLSMDLLFLSDLEKCWPYFFKYFSNIPTSGISIAYIFGTLTFHSSYWLLLFSQFSSFYFGLFPLLGIH